MDTLDTATWDRLVHDVPRVPVTCASMFQVLERFALTGIAVAIDSGLAYIQATLDSLTGVSNKTRSSKSPTADRERVESSPRSIWVGFSRAPMVTIDDATLTPLMKNWNVSPLYDAAE